MKRGLSEVESVVLVVAITALIAVVAFYQYTQMGQGVTSKVSDKLETSPLQEGMTLSIEGSSGNTLFIKNYGSKKADGFAFYLDKVYYPYTSGPDELNTDETGTFAFNIAYGKHEVKLTTSTGLMVKGLETFGLQYAPTISNVSFSPGGNSATITWTTDTIADSTVNYGKTTGLGSTETESALVTGHEITLTGLDPSTDYYFEVVSTNTIGTTTDDNGGSYYLFTTTSDITDPVVSNVGAEFYYSGNDAFGNKQGNLKVSWDTNENADSYTEATYKGGSIASGSDATLELTHSIGDNIPEGEVLSVVIDLDTNYALKIRSRDASGNPVTGFNREGTYNCPAATCSTIGQWCNCTVA